MWVFKSSMHTNLAACGIAFESSKGNNYFNHHILICKYALLIYW